MFRFTFALTALGIVSLAAPAQTTGTWQSTGNGPYNWTDTANWVGGVVPNGPFDTADFSTAALTGFPDISLNQPIQVRFLTFANGSNGYFFEPGAAGFFAFGSSAGITTGSQGVNIFAPITTSGLAVNTTVAGNTVALAGLIEPPANLPSATLVKSGPGGLDFSSATTQNVFVDILVNGGFVQMELPTALEASNVTLTSSNGLQFSTLTSATVGSLTLNPNVNLALTNTTPAAVALTLGAGSFSGTTVVSGAGSLNVAAGTNSVGFGTSVSQTYSGGTTVSSGVLQLDFSNMTSPANLLNPSQTLTLASGQLLLNGKNNAASSQSFTGFSLVGGQASVSLTPNGTGSMTLALPNAWTRSPGATVDFTIPTGATVSSAPVASGFVGAFATVNADDWASVSGGQLVAFTGYTNNTFTPGNHVNVTGSQSASGVTVASIRMDDGSVLTLSGTNTVTTGGVLVRGNTISGGTLQGPASGELILNTGSSGGSTVTSTIVDNGGATALTVAGIGGLTLGGANTYTGPTYLNVFATIPALNDGGVASGIGQSSNAAGSLVLNGAVLTATTGAFSDRLFTLGPAGGGFSSPSGQLFFSNVNPIAFSGVGSRTLTLAGGSTDVSNPNVFSPILNDPTGGTLGVTITGGVWILGANNFFTGPLLVELNATLITDTLAMRGFGSPFGASNRPDALSFQFASTLQYTGGSVTTNRPILFGGNSALDVTTAGTTVTLTGGGIQGNVLLTGPGTVTFAGQRPFVGTVVINNGKAILGDNNVFAGVTVSPAVPTGGFQFAPGVTAPTLAGFGGTGNINLQTTASETVNVSLVGGSNYSGVLSGPGSVTVVSGGHTFSGANTYSGGTTIQANGIVASNTSGSATGSGPVVVTGGALTGTGTVTGPVTLQGPNSSTLAGPGLTVTGAVNALNGSAFLQPGQQFNTVGLLTVGNTTLNGGANYIWAVNNWTASPVAGTDFSQIKGVNGTTSLDMSGASSTNRINLIIEGNPTGFNQAQGRQWLIANYASLTNFSSAAWTINTSNFTPAIGTGQFSLAQSGPGGILLTFNPVPEPWAVMSMCGLAASAWFGWRRRSAGSCRSDVR